MQVIVRIVESWREEAC